MTIEKATIMRISKQHTISNNGVRKFWIYWTLYLLTWNHMKHLGNFDYFLGFCIFDGHFTNFATNFWEISIISSNKGGNRWTIDEVRGFMEYSRYFQNPSQATQATLTQRQRKFELFNPSQV